MQRPGVDTFEEAVCILQSQATIYQGLTRIVNTLALATVIKNDEFRHCRTKAPMTWKLGLAHAAKLVKDYLTSIKAKSSQLSSVSWRLESEIKGLAVSMSQAAAERAPLSVSGLCCSLDLERHERLLSFQGLAMDLDNLCEQVKEHPTAWPEPVRLSLELIEKDCIWIIERLAYQVAYVVLQSAPLSLSMCVPNVSDQTPPGEWEALRKQQPLAWLLQRLYGARGNLIELIKLLLQYIDKHANQFHSRIGATVDDFRMVRDVLVATEALRPSYKNTLDGDDELPCAVSSYLNVFEDLEDLPIEISGVTSDLVWHDPLGTMEEEQLKQVLRGTTDIIRRYICRHPVMTDELVGKAEDVLGTQQPLQKSPEIDNLTESFERIEIEQLTTIRARPPRRARQADPTMGELAPAVATRPEKKIRMLGALSRNSVCEDAPQQQASLGQAIFNRKRGEGSREKPRGR